jgi:hypothetical protein
MGLDLLINQFGAILGLLIFIALGVGAFFGRVIYTRTDAASYVQKTDSSTEKTYADALLMLARNGDTSTQIQREIGTSMREFTAELRGMLSMLDASMKVARTTAMGLDDISGQMPAIRTHVEEIPGIRDSVKAIHTVTATLETNLGESFGESIKDQLAPAVTVLMRLDQHVEKLTADSLERDGRTTSTLIELMGLVKEFKTEFLQKVERYVLRDINQFLPPDKPLEPTETNGNTTKEHNLPIDITITSAKDTQ